MAYCDELNELYPQQLPHLQLADHQKTSEKDHIYNCIAYVFGEAGQWFWPAENDLCVWPRPIVLEQSCLENFRLLLRDLGYSPCKDGTFEPNVIKIACYVGGGGIVPEDLTHAAIQRTEGPDAGYWSSKIGPNIDIRHKTIEDLDGPLYGRVHSFYAKPVVTAQTT